MQTYISDLQKICAEKKKYEKKSLVKSTLQRYEQKLKHIILKERI